VDVEKSPFFSVFSLLLAEKISQHSMKNHDPNGAFARFSACTFQCMYLKLSLIKCIAVEDIFNGRGEDSWSTKVDRDLCAGSLFQL
jgi:hypothetical protein